MTMAIRIVIADDADLLLAGAQTVLSVVHRFSIVGLARCVDDLFQAIDKGLPDVVILSEQIYNLDIVSVVERLKAQRPALKIIVMGGLTNGILIRDLLACGVNGYLNKSDDLCELLTIAVETVMRDRLYLSPTATAEYLLAMQTARTRELLDTEARQVLQLLAHGEHAGEISERLGIGKRRVYWVREKLRRRFGAKTNEHLIQRAAAEGFIYARD